MTDEVRQAMQRERDIETTKLCAVCFAITFIPFILGGFTALFIVAGIALVYLLATDK